MFSRKDSSVIDSLASISRKLYWAKSAIFIVGVVLTSFFAFILIRSDLFESDIYLIPSILGSVWAWLFLFLVTSFTNVPNVPDTELGFFKRLKIRLKRFLFYFS